jgi:signal transduction histidine kinase
MKKVIMFLLVHSCVLCVLKAQETSNMPLKIKTIPAEGILLEKGWSYHSGDNMEWAKPDFDDRHWQAIDPTQDIYDLPQLWQTDIGWFRLHLSVDSLVRQQSLVLLVNQTIASEIYINGHLIRQLGIISLKQEEVQAMTLPAGELIALPLKSGADQVLAVRFALQTNIPYIQFGNRPNPCLQIIVNELGAASSYVSSNDITSYEYFRAGTFFILAILHLGFFWFYPAQKANLYFFLYAFLYALSSSALNMAYKVYSIDIKMYLFAFAFGFGAIINSIFYLKALYQLFNLKKGFFFWVLSIGLILLFPLSFWPFYKEAGVLFQVFFVLFSLESIRITILAIRGKKRGARILAGGAISFFVFVSLFEAMAFGYLPPGPNWIIGHWCFSLAVLSFPISISLFLALEFAFTSHSLETKLIEVQKLSEKTLAQEKEKQQILAVQNETLDQQVSERTAEVVAQKEELQSTLEHLKATQAQLIQKEKMASLGELTAGIAHEIQNPLNFVNNFSEVSQELCSEIEEETKAGNTQEVLSITADLKQNLEKIHHHGKRADSIVKGMLEHSRASSGEKQLTDINTLVEEYLRLSYHGLRVRDKDFNADFTFTPDTSLPHLEVAPQEIGRVLLNLFNNAFYATEQKKAQLNGQYQPQVIVSTKATRDKVEVRVRDNGTGIPEGVQQKIFQPFFTTKPTGEGTGLGLSLSYDIIAKGHRGELRVESLQGEFTEFIIWLPTGK